MTDSEVCEAERTNAECNRCRHPVAHGICHLDWALGACPGRLRRGGSAATTLLSSSRVLSRPDTGCPVVVQAKIRPGPPRIQQRSLVIGTPSAAPLLCHSIVGASGPSQRLKSNSLTAPERPLELDLLSPVGPRTGASD